MAAIEVMQMPQWQLDQAYMRKSVSSDITSSDKILSRLFNITSRNTPNQYMFFETYVYVCICMYMYVYYIYIHIHVYTHNLYVYLAIFQSYAHLYTHMYTFVCLLTYLRICSLFVHLFTYDIHVLIYNVGT